MDGCGGWRHNVGNVHSPEGCQHRTHHNSPSVIFLCSPHPHLLSSSSRDTSTLQQQWPNSRPHTTLGVRNMSNGTRAAGRLSPASWHKKPTHPLPIRRYTAARSCLRIHRIILTISIEAGVPCSHHTNKKKSRGVVGWERKHQYPNLTGLYRALIDRLHQKLLILRIMYYKTF